jgi:von Willebrand factor type D domain
VLRTLDPHFRTYDGSFYSYHGECDLVMARSPTFGEGLGLDVHARTEIIGGTWSLISNVAVKIGEDIFEVANDGVHYLNGVPNVELPAIMSGSYQISKSEINLADDGADSPAIKTKYAISLDQEDQIQIANFLTMLSVSVTAILTDASGMLGTSYLKGMIGRGGESIVGDNPNEMGAQWQVIDVEPMLFHNIRAPQFPEACVLPVNSIARRLRQSDKMYKMASDACADVEGEERNFCIDDVLVMGDILAAKTYASALK